MSLLRSTPAAQPHLPGPRITLFGSVSVCRWGHHQMDPSRSVRCRIASRGGRDSSSRCAEARACTNAGYVEPCHVKSHQLTPPYSGTKYGLSVEKAVRAWLLM